MKFSVEINLDDERTKSPTVLMRLLSDVAACIRIATSMPFDPADPIPPHAIRDLTEEHYGTHFGMLLYLDDNRDPENYIGWVQVEPGEWTPRTFDAPVRSERTVDGKWHDVDIPVH